MSRSAPDVMGTATPAAVAAGDVLIVEAASAELALQEVAAKLGDQVEILGAEKLRRGGVGGFFAQEVCRLTVRVPGAEVSPQATAADRAAVIAEHAAPGPLGVDEALRLMTEATSLEEHDFASLLRTRMTEDAIAPQAAAASRAAHIAQKALLEQMQEAPAVAEDFATAPLPPSVRPAPRIGWTRDPEAMEGSGPVRWSAGTLDRLGLPAVLIAAVEAQEPVDDTGWLVALAAAVAPYCRPLPTGSAVVVGPKAGALGTALELPVVRRPETPPADGTVCVQLKDTLPARDWLASIRGTRWTHVVVGGSGWHGLLFDEPLAVSWVGADALPAALHQCAAFGLVLGYGLDAPGGTPLRANPLDVALTVRSLLVRR